MRSSHRPCPPLVPTGFVAVLLLSALACGGSQPPATGGDGQVPAGQPPAAPAVPASPPAAGPGGTAPSPAPAAPKPAPPLFPAEKTVATVNGTPILGGKVDEVVKLNRARLQADGQRLPEGADRQMAVVALEILVDGELMRQAALASGMKADPKEVDEAMQRGRSQLGSEEAYKKFLERTGLTEERLRAEVAEQVLIGTYQKAATADVKVTEDAARKFYDGHKEAMKGSDEAHALHILVRVAESDPPAKRDEAKKRADEALQKVKAGTDFAAVAKEYSQAPNAAKGGDLGFFPRGVMVPKFEEVAFTLPIGQVSPVFETPFGFNILKVLERREGKIPSFDEVKAFLLMQLTKQEQGQALGKRLAELRSKAKIEILEPSLVPKPETQAAP